MSKIKDELIEQERQAHIELCSREPEPKCEYCKESTNEDRNLPGTNIRQWQVEDYQRNPNPLG